MGNDTLLAKSMGRYRLWRAVTHIHLTEDEICAADVEASDADESQDQSSFDLLPLSC